MAGLNIGELRVQIEAEIGSLRRDLLRAQSQINRFAKKTEKRVNPLSKGFASLRANIKLVTGAVAALGAAVAIGGLFQLARGALAAAGAVQGFENQLKAILGSQGRANAALKEFTELASLTPFALAEVVQGGTVLATATTRSGASLRELTVIAANLATVTGLDFPIAAANLQRSLLGGLASADLFRERGVKALIEELDGIGDATKLGPEALAEAFRRLAGESGRFGTAAADAVNTIDGALSNVGDSIFNFQTALGEAFGPGTIAGAREFIIPFFEDLQRIVEENSNTIGSTFVTAIAGAIGFLGDFASALAGLNTILSSVFLGIDQISGVLRVLFNLGQIFFRGFAVGFEIVRIGAVALLAEINGVRAGIVGFIDSFKTIESVSVETLTNQLRDATEELGEFNAKVPGAIFSNPRTFAGLRRLEDNLFRIREEFNRRGIELPVDIKVSEVEKDLNEALVGLFQRTDELGVAVAGDLIEGFEALGQITSGDQAKAVTEFLESLSKSSDDAAKRVVELADKLKALREQQKAARDTGEVDAASARATAEQIKGLTELERIQARIKQQVEAQARARIAAGSPILAQLTDLQKQIVVLRELNLFERDRIRANQTIAELTERQIELARQLSAAGAESQFLQADIEQQTVSIGDIDAASGRNFERKLEDLLAKGLSGEKLQKALERLQTEVQRELEDAARDVSPTFGTELAANVKDTFAAALKDGSFDFLDAFGEALRNTAAEKLAEGFAQATETLADSLADILLDLGSLLADVFSGSSKEGTSEGIGGVLTSLGSTIAGVFSTSSKEGTQEGVTEGTTSGLQNLGSSIGPVIGGLIGAALRSEQVTSTSLLSSAAASGITSAQQTRGVVVGPTSIGVADVGRSIQTAFLESERLLGIIARNTTPQASDTTGSLGATTDEVTATLANESPSLF